MLYLEGRTVKPGLPVGPTALISRGGEILLDSVMVPAPAWPAGLEGAGSGHAPALGHFDLVSGQLRTLEGAALLPAGISSYVHDAGNVL